MVDLTMVIWLLIAGLAYVLVTCVVGTLASRVKNERDRHDLVVEARRRRKAYLDKLNDNGPASDEDVELV
ncbi:hypothetical protein ACERK3_04040 [Phycisphaerales bacterium AB-hyl4]|uniref:CcmD family protein n=1 Tax=Natronomicrosphaera hydrolytica TaxID=3242702 RepID=A0ABV4U2Q3_9BACT